MERFNLDEWLTERYSPLTLERIKKAHFKYDDVVEILNVALRQPPVSGSVCDNCGEGKPAVCAKCYETESNFRESY